MTDNEALVRPWRSRAEAAKARADAADERVRIYRTKLETTEARVAVLEGALNEIDTLDPAHFKSGDHLTPASREVDFREAFRAVCRIVNRVLHNTDENGRPL